LSQRDLLDDATVDSWLSSHSTWSVSNGHLVREIRTKDYPSAVQILSAQVEMAQRLDHHPVVTVAYNSLRFELWTHVAGGLSELDLDYANALDEIVLTQFANVVTT
jgi:4a-hydroxytetrahydrobiopterin dehydratase